MDNTPEDAPLAREPIAGSEEALIVRTRPARGSNSRAFKVAGLTTLACLLLGSQVFTAYMVFGQRQQIQDLKGNNERLSKLVTRSNQAPVRMQMPMRSLPMMKAFDPEADHTPIVPKPTEKEIVISVEKQVKDLLQNFTLPEFNSTFITNLLVLKGQMDDITWQKFESWMQFWLIFQMAQQKPPTASPTPAPVMTKCQKEAATVKRLLGVHKPQCDERGQYEPVQCWHSTNMCWCVDSSGLPIPGTTVRGGRPQCPRAASTGHMMVAPLREMAGLEVGDK